MHPPSPPTTPWTTQIPGEGIECREQPDAHAGTFLTETAGETVGMSSLSLPDRAKESEWKPCHQQQTAWPLYTDHDYTKNLSPRIARWDRQGLLPGWTQLDGCEAWGDSNSPTRRTRGFRVEVAILQERLESDSIQNHRLVLY
jgi:hypothetical protein